MGDEVITNTAPVVGAGPSAGAPNTVATQTPTAAPEAAPSQTPSASAPTTPDASLLGDVAATEPSPAPISPDVKETPATDTPAVETPATEPKPETPAEPVKPTYEAFKLPDGIQVQEDKLSEFTNDLADFELGAKDHASTQEFGQKLLDKHIVLVTDAVKNAIEMNKSADLAKHNEWREQTKKDPIIGGNRLETTKSDALKFIRTHGGTAAQQQEFIQLMNETGVGNHPAMIRMLAQAGKNMSEPRPLAATKPASKPENPIDKRYKNSTPRSASK